MTEFKPELIYIADAMCSWCYGFSDQYKEIRESLGDKVRHRIIMGGLRPFNKEVMDDDLKAFLNEHWNKIEGITGRKISRKLFDSTEFVYDTEPPSRAIVTVRYMNPDLVYTFLEKVQQKFYGESKDTNEIEFYLDIISELGLDEKQFQLLFVSDEIKQATIDDFETSKKLNITGFPSVLLDNGNVSVISRGYAKADSIISKINFNLNHGLAKIG